MRKSFMLLLILICLCGAVPVRADSALSVVYGETYMCGDSFEVILQDEPQLTSMVSRKPSPGRSVVILKAGMDEILMVVRLKIRSLTDTVFNGFSPESFQLVGYIRGRALTYTPEVMAPYDYGSKEHYTLYDKMYYQTYVMAPLRKVDMMLVYRVNPVVRDWELHLAPAAANGTEQTYMDAAYSPMDLAVCDATMRFTTVRNIDTGKIIKYYR